MSAAGDGREFVLYCGWGEDDGEEEIGNGTRDRREKELRRRGLFNSNLPTQSVRLSVCPSVGDH